MGDGVDIYSMRDGNEEKQCRKQDREGRCGQERFYWGYDI